MGFETGAGEFMSAGSYSAAQMRRSAYAWAARTSANVEGTISGGLLSATDMQISNAVSGLVVNTSTGACLIGGTEATSQGGYHAFLSSINSTTLATANGSNPRVDAICATSADAAYTIPSGGSSGFVTIQGVTGTPTSGATLTNLSGAPSLPASSLLLGYVLVPAAATNLVSGDILNVATPVRLGGTFGPYALLATSTFSGSFTGAPSAFASWGTPSVAGFAATGDLSSSTNWTCPTTGAYLMNNSFEVQNSVTTTRTFSQIVDTTASATVLRGMSQEGPVATGLVFGMGVSGLVFATAGHVYQVQWFSSSSVGFSGNTYANYWGINRVA